MLELSQQFLQIGTLTETAVASGTTTATIGDPVTVKAGAVLVPTDIECHLGASDGSETANFYLEDADGNVYARRLVRAAGSQGNTGNEGHTPKGKQIGPFSVDKTLTLKVKEITRGASNPINVSGLVTCHDVIKDPAEIYTSVSAS